MGKVNPACLSQRQRAWAERKNASLGQPEPSPVPVIEDTTKKPVDRSTENKNSKKKKNLEEKEN